MTESPYIILITLTYVLKVNYFLLYINYGKYVRSFQCLKLSGNPDTKFSVAKVLMLRHAS